MKNTLFKSILVLVMAFLALPMMGQDWMEIYFKNGDSRTIYLKNVLSMITSQYDEIGVYHGGIHYQHITTKLNKFVYNIDDIDSIRFTKYDEEVVMSNIIAAQNVIEPILFSCKTVQDVEMEMDKIKSAKGVDDAWIVGPNLFVKIAGWEQIAYHLEHEQSDESVIEINKRNIKKDNSDFDTKTIKEGDRPLKVIIANQEHYDSRRTSQITACKNLQKDFNDCNIIARYLDRPKLSFFLNDLYYYDVAFLITHGLYNGQRHSLVTADSLGISHGNDSDETKAEWAKNMQELRATIPAEVTPSHIYMCSTDEYRNGVKCIIKRPALTELFFEEIVDAQFNNPHSLFFNVACHSLEENDNLGDSFLNRGLGVYLGYTRENSLGDEAGVSFLQSMLEGKSLGVAYRDLDSNYRQENKPDGGVAKLRVIYNKDIEGDPRDLFLVSIYSIEKDNNSAHQEYNETRPVTIEGITTILGKTETPVTMGFIIGSVMSLEDGEKIEISGYDTVDNYGNRKFYSYLNNLERNKTYHYRAFTYDGKNYNYGDTYSFTIENSSIEADKELMITKNVNGTVYSIYKKTLDENDYHTNPDGWKCYRTQLTLEITKNGTTNSYVVDNNIYLDKEEDHHGGQQPCMLLDFNKNMIYIFCNSKDDLPYYSMDGNFYSSSMSNINFTKETVFETANWGWFPYFCDFGDDNINLCNFSFAGYFTIMAVRDTSGNWNLYHYNTDISPEEAQAEWEQADKILVIETPL